MRGALFAAAFVYGVISLYGLIGCLLVAPSLGEESQPGSWYNASSFLLPAVTLVVVAGAAVLVGSRRRPLKSEEAHTGAMLLALACIVIGAVAAIYAYVLVDDAPQIDRLITETGRLISTIVMLVVAAVTLAPLLWLGVPPEAEPSTAARPDNDQ